MLKKPNKSGGGNQTNINGLAFEKRSSLRDVINNNSQFKIKENDVFKNGIPIGKIFEPKSGNTNWAFYKFLKSEFGINAKEELSKTIHPDKIFYNIFQKRFYVIECKYQMQAGSVDEKLQTFIFKRSILNYLLFNNEKSKDVDLEYLYVLDKGYFGKLNKDGKTQKFHDVFKFIRENGSSYYFDTIPLHKLGIF